MDPKLLEPMKKIMEELIEEKIQLKSQTERLNKIYTNREKSFEEYQRLYLEIKNSIELYNSKLDLEKVLNHQHIVPLNGTNEHSINKVKSSQNELNEKHPSSYKGKFKTFRKKLSLLAQEIKTELDVYQVCFAGDVEAIYGKIQELKNSQKKHSAKGRVLEYYESEENIEMPLEVNISNGENIKEEKKETEKQDITEESAVENFSRISFSGIKKKNLKDKKIQKKTDNK